MTELFELQCGDVTASVNPHGAYLESLTLHDGGLDVPLLFPKTDIGDKSRGGCFVAVPYFGPAPTSADMPQHGFGRDLEWVTRQVNLSTVICNLDIHPPKKGETPHFRNYPGFSAVLGYRLLPDEVTTAKLQADLIVSNTSPVLTEIVAPGFHPYFVSDGSGVIELLLDEGKELEDAETQSRQVFDMNNLVVAETIPMPSGKKVNFHSETGEVEITTNKNLGAITLWSDGLGNYVCVEPTHSGASFSNPPEDISAIELVPGSEMHLSMTCAWRLDI